MRLTLTSGGRRDDERHVHVGGQRLLPRLGARALAREESPALDDALDRVALDGDPVSDRGVDVARGRTHAACAVVDQVLGRVVREHTRGHLAWTGDLFELFFEAGVPAQRSKQRKTSG